MLWALSIHRERNRSDCSGGTVNALISVMGWLTGSLPVGLSWWLVPRYTMPSLKPAAPMPSARLKRPRRFSNAMWWVSSTIWPSSRCWRSRSDRSPGTSRGVRRMPTASSRTSSSGSVNSGLVRSSGRARISWSVNPHWREMAAPRAHVDAVCAVGEGGRLQLGEGVEPAVETVQLGGCLFELGVALEEHGHVGVQLQRLDHPLGLPPGELGDAAPGEVVGDLHLQPGLGGRDAVTAGHVAPPLADDRCGDR